MTDINKSENNTQDGVEKNQELLEHLDLHSSDYPYGSEVRDQIQHQINLNNQNK